MMNKEIEVRQHNALTNARYEYSELQLDLLFFLLSKLRKDHQDRVYELNIKDLSLLTGKKIQCRLSAQGHVRYGQPCV